MVLRSMKNLSLTVNGRLPAGPKGVEMLLERGAKFSALVASNDDMAIGAMKALHERGVAVPEQVSVIGFDDIAIAPYTVPALSSVKIPVTEMIQEIIGRLIFMLDGGDFLTAENLQRKTDPPRLTPLLLRDKHCHHMSSSLVSMTSFFLHYRN
ncbi:transcriptional regulator [Escherichia coli]|uniref:Transcriptional regulator n=1 Tax=Escherichia coli TaxID=562 RepID=A0A2X1KBH5_ECOLX|nr:transcriptional regulator [Escherichia coli]